MKTKYVVGVSGIDALEWVRQNTDGQQLFSIGVKGPKGENIWCKAELSTSAELALYLMAYPNATVY